MKSEELSRRRFITRSVGVAAGAGLVSAQSLPLFGAPGTITAADVIDRLERHIPMAPRQTTVDGIKGGGRLDTVISGITTTFMSTLDVIQRSKRAGNNFVITHEPTFWSNPDAGEGLETDPVFQHKLDFIRRNEMVIYRFHDRWHSRVPDGIVEGQTRQLGWEKYDVDEIHNVVVLPATTTLSALVQQLKVRLNSDSIRAMGNPRLQVKKVGRGFNKLAGEVEQLSFADAFIVKEADRENDLVEWCRDTVSSGGQKGFIFISHNRGEEFGMENCARWARTFISEVPIAFIQSGDTFWRTLK